MDIFKRELAPLSSEAWAEIEKRAKTVLLAKLTARKVIGIEGPKGLGYTTVNEGRLNLVDDGDVKAGVYAVKPLTEARIRFSLNRWEVDNLSRGAKDINFDNLDAAIDKLATFEENAVYNGYAKGGIKGLIESSAHKPLEFGTDANAILLNLAEGVITLKKNYNPWPYNLIVGKKAWLELNKETQGTSLYKLAERSLGGKITYSSSIEGALLLPANDGNVELTIGQDFALGYESHDTKELTLFATESFTFRVLNPKAIVVFK